MDEIAYLTPVKMQAEIEDSNAVRYWNEGQ